MKQPTAPSTGDLFPGGVFYLAIAILLFSFGFVVLSQTVWDYDFWWHIVTGRYIVQTGHLPQADPFSFTSTLTENNNLYPLRERFILTQYWLAQVLMYLLFQYFGASGIAILRVSLLLGAVYVIYRALKSRGVSPYIAYLSIFLATGSEVRFFGDRPVLFTVFFSVVCFVIVDDYVQKRSRLFYLLPGVMLLWANLHGGFILGIAIILVFMVMEGVKLVLGKSAFSEREKAIFFLVLFLSIGISWLNPDGFMGFQIAFSKEYVPFYNGIQEYQSPIDLFISKKTETDYVYFASLLLFPLVFFLRRRKFNPTHLVLLIFLAAESLSAARFTVYYGMLASFVLGNELDLWLKGHRERLVFDQKHLNVVFSAIMLASSALYYWGVVDLDHLNMRSSRTVNPVVAADFIKGNHIKGNMYNDMASGGYLAWRLYPDVKTFIDTRALNYTVMREYSWIGTATESAYGKTLAPGKTPLWKRLLDHYKIDIVVFNPLDVYGEMLPLAVKLLEDKDWVPVSTEMSATVFVRNIPEYQKIIETYRQTEDEVCEAIVVRASFYAMVYERNPRYLMSLGEIFVKMGKKDDAIKAYEYALRRLPDSPVIKEKLDSLKKEKAEVKNEQ